MSDSSASRLSAPPTATVPATAARPGYIVMLLITWFCFYAALLGPAIVGVGVKVLTIVPESEKASALAWISGFGALAAAIANPVFGRISDRTTSRWGRRRPWIVAGMSGLVVGFICFALAPNVPTAVVAWAFCQFCANAALSPLTASVADQVPSFQRGQVTASLGIALNLGIMASTWVAKIFVDQLIILFVAPSLIALGVIIAYAFVLPDRVLPERPPREGFKAVLKTFWVNPRTYPDYAFAWWSKFMIVLATNLFTTFRLFFIKDKIGLSVEEAAGTVALGVLIYTLVLMPSAWIAGKLSDKVGRRKPFVITSGIIFGIGTALLMTAHTVEIFYVVEAILGLAYGVYVGVDLALVMDVLPDPENPGKDLGVFNIANAVPQSAGPLVGALLLSVGSAVSQNYTLLLIVAGIMGVIGGLVLIPIKKVR
ncbi:MFS transporter [Microbacterium sp. B2969]|uniref:MFS transporter n=1 Tax=Microbacterium alkaliflavum TaxID=3248839 RepID=A0ABW7QFZ9_9MICO